MVHINLYRQMLRDICNKEIAEIGEEKKEFIGIAIVVRLIIMICALVSWLEQGQNNI